MLDGENLLGGWFEATPDGWNDPIRKEVPLKRYIKTTREGKVTRFWSEDNQPEQICKVAESQGLRATWPDEFSGLYTDAERESMEAQAGFDQSVAGAAEAEVKKENLEKNLGQAKDTTAETGPPAAEPKTPPIQSPGAIPPAQEPDPDVKEKLSPEDQARASTLYQDFDPYTEKVSKRYAFSKLLKLADELDKHNVEYQKSWTGSMLHLALVNYKIANPKADEPDPPAAQEPPADHGEQGDASTQEAEPDPDDDPQVVQSLRADVARAKIAEPELYRYAYTNQLTQGTVRPETKTSEMEAAECRAILNDLMGQVDMRNASMVAPA
jgi:hypothetical protein